VNKRIIIVDLDGTLYDSVSRSHFAKAGMWDEFHSHSSLDKPNFDVLDLVKELGRYHTMLGITGRNERYRKITDHWLNRWQVPLDDLLMRPDGNFNSDPEVKLSLLHKWLGKNQRNMREIWFALEDRDKMVDAWRNANIPCYQVRSGEY
jgi:FMN phosphatase YigB (HAD superfamily)